MPSEAATVIIDAEDLASKKIEAAAKAIENNIKGIKEVGGRAKASTEFIGTLANSLGGTEIGSYAGQLAGLTEKVSQFSEVQKVGGAGAMAFKAGLVGVAAVITYQVSTAIAKMVFDIDGAEKRMREAFAAMDDAAQGFATAQSRRHAKDMEELQIGTAEEQNEKQLAKLAELNKELAVSGQRYQQLATQQQVLAESASLWDQYVSGASKSQIEDLEKRRQLELDNFHRLQDQQTAVRDLLDEEKKLTGERKLAAAASEKSDAYIQTLKEELELLKATKEEVLAITAARNTTAEDRGQAEQLLKQIDAIKQAAEEEKKAADARERANQKAEQDMQRLMSQRENLEEKLKEEELARAKRLNAETSLSGSQSRLLTRGPGDDQQKQIVDNTKKTADKLEEVKNEISKLTMKNPGMATQTLEIVE
jgi:DNA repair exonuclease SbcCD ATPase subunit